MQTNASFQRTTIFALVLSLLLMAAGSMPSRAQEKSLYERIGGYNALAAVVDDFVGRLAQRFRRGHKENSAKDNDAIHERRLLGWLPLSSMMSPEPSEKSAHALE